MLIDTLQKEKEFLGDYNKIIAEINLYFAKDKGFTLRDLLDEDESKDNYYIYLTKGIIQSLIYFGYVEIFSLYYGKNSFVYRAKKKIDFKK